MTISIILVKPQLGENIGAAARVMKNFELSDLRIVAPRDGWPNDAAEVMAAGAKDVVESATLYDTTQEAVADLHVVYATTGRRRDMEKRVLSCRGAVRDMVSRHAHSQEVGVLFGAERCGLENEDIALSDTILTIPVGELYPSLNLAQAVALVCYEWMAAQGMGVPSIRDLPAEKESLYALFDHLEKELDERQFWKVDEKKPAMWRNIRNMLQRAEMTEQEVRTLHGIIRCLSDY